MRLSFLSILISVCLVYSCSESEKNEITDIDNNSSDTVSNESSAFNMKASWNIVSEINSTTNLKVEYSMVYDSVNDLIIAFGGRGSDWEEINQTWIFDYDDLKWKDMNPSNSPPWRHNSKMAYDGKRKLVYMFGGSNLENTLNDLWLYDYNENNWAEAESENKPEARQMHGLTYIPITDQLIVFGGRKINGGAYYNDTWIYEFSNNNWIKIETTLSPAIQDHIVMSYNPYYKKVILYEYLEGDKVSNLWAYNPDERNWEIISENDSAICGHAYLNYLDKHNASVLFGVQNGTNELQTWLFNHDSNKWYDITPEIMPADHIEHADMVYLSKHNVFILHGGCCSDNTLELKLKNSI